MVIDLGWLEPAAAASALAGLGGLAWLDSAAEDPGRGRYSYLAAAPAVWFEIRDGRLWRDGRALTGAPLPALRAALGPPRPPRPGLPPFSGGLIGALAYEFGATLEKLPVPVVGDPAIPQGRFGLYRRVIAFDHQQRRAWLVTDDPADDGADWLARLAAPPSPLPAPPPLDWQATIDQADYQALIAEVVEAILAGEIFQANIAQSFTAAVPPDFSPFAYYQALRRHNPAPFAAYLDWGAVVVASASPERFLRLAGGRVEARPIKGTAPRGRTPDEDRALAAALSASVKDQAENAMIVDLLRNDLSRVSRPGSVAVPVLAGLESYAAVHHLVSVVVSELAAGRDGFDLLAAAFPCGSITGAPKIRAMEIIASIERRQRGLYCGSIGWIGHDGAMDFNVAIRTVIFSPLGAVFSAGGGITALSDPADEYQETLTKAGRVIDLGR